MRQDICSRVDQTADTHLFGTPVAVYQQMFSPATKRRRYAVMLLIIVLIMALPSSVLVNSFQSLPKQSLAIMVSTVLFILFSIISLILVLLVVRSLTISWRVYLYTEGFISAKGRKINAIRWDQVTAIREAMPPSGTASLDTLSLANGPKLTFDTTFLNVEIAPFLNPRDRDLPRFTWGLPETEVTARYAHWVAAKSREEELIHTMEREILTRLYPSMVVTYQAGSLVAFGPLQISTKGITHGKATLPWDEVEHIILRGVEDDPVPDNAFSEASQTLIERLAWWQREVSPHDTIFIIRKNQHDVFWSERVSKVPNAFLLMELVNDALRHNKD